MIKACKNEIYSFVMQINRTHDLIFRSHHMFKNYIYERLVVPLNTRSPRKQVKAKIIKKLISGIDNKFYLKLRNEYFSIKDSTNSGPTNTRENPKSHEKSLEPLDKSKNIRVPKFRDSCSLLGIDKSKLRTEWINHSQRRRRARKIDEKLS